MLLARESQLHPSSIVNHQSWKPEWTLTEGSKDNEV
jgi:hypothetical protein